LNKELTTTRTHEREHKLIDAPEGCRYIPDEGATVPKMGRVGQEAVRPAT